MPANRLNQNERTIVGRIGAYKSWGNTEDRTARTANARNVFESRFLKAADGDHQRAEMLRREYFARLAYKSAQARKRRGGTAVAESHDAVESRLAIVESRLAELDAGGDHGA